MLSERKPEVPLRAERFAKRTQWKLATGERHRPSRKMWTPTAPHPDGPTKWASRRTGLHDCRGALPFEVKVPNAVTARTLRKANRGEDLVRSKNAADLCGKLGIWCERQFHDGPYATVSLSGKPSHEGRKLPALWQRAYEGSMIGTAPHGS